MTQTTKDILKHEITVLQQTLGVHFITTRNIRSIQEGREALVQIVKTFKNNNRDVTNELLTDNKIAKHKLWKAEELLKEKKQELNKIVIENKKLVAKNEELQINNKNLNDLCKYLFEKTDYYEEQLLKSKKTWLQRIFG